MYLPTTRCGSDGGCAFTRRTISSQRERSIGPGGKPEELDDGLVQALVVEGERHLVDRVHVPGRDHRLFLDVAEERDLGLGGGRQRMILGGPAQEHVGLDTDGPQLLDRVPGWPWS